MASKQGSVAAIVAPWIANQVQDHRSKQGATCPPLLIGLNGIQGIGKTTLVTNLSSTLAEPPHNLRVLTLSIDDFYLPHHLLQALAAANPTNPLLQHRGQPSSHDVPLAISTLKSLKADTNTRVPIPSFDKSAHAGRGDRVPENQWDVAEGHFDVILLEGWCVGFSPLSQASLQVKWSAAVTARAQNSQLAYQRLEDVATVNSALHDYVPLIDLLDAFILLDAVDTHWVYDWRLEQERGLRESRGAGMSDEQVRAFVDGYYPAYELYLEDLRAGKEVTSGGRPMLRVTVGRGREVVDSVAKGGE